MTRVLITGSTSGLGLLNARTLIAAGHEVVLHARSPERALDIAELVPKATGIVFGDLSSADETFAVADQVNAIGPMTAVIHNAGIYLTPQRVSTREGHSQTFAVNVLAPYLLTALIEQPDRLVYVTSGMQFGAHPSLDDLDWTRRTWNSTAAYCESKLLLCTLAAVMAEQWQTTSSNAVDPGWVPTRMGGPAASDDLELGHRTQTWLATSDDPEATVSGKYWFHQQQQTPPADVRDPAFQDALIERLANMTGVDLV